MPIAIITGASSGMGKEFVRLAVNDQTVYDEIWVIARRKERLQRWPELYKKQQFRILALDLTREEDIDHLKTELISQHPQVGLFVHCAGFGVMGRIEEISAKDQAEMVDLNCRSVTELTSMLLPFMGEGSRMIYLASAAAFLPQPGFAVYAASKAFTLSYVRALRSELKGRSIKVTAVCPGAVKTEFFNRAAEKKDLPPYKKLVMANPEKVVRKAWKDSLAGREVSIWGIPMNLFHLAAKLLPHSLFLKFM